MLKTDLNTGFVAYLAELFTTKHFSSNANEYKKTGGKCSNSACGLALKV